MSLMRFRTITIALTAALVVLGALGVAAAGLGLGLALRRRRVQRREGATPGGRRASVPRPGPAVIVAGAAASEASSPAPAAAPAPEPTAPVAGLPGTAKEASDPLYDDATCRAFAGGLSDEVLDRAVILFSRLARQGRVDAAGLSSALGARSRDLGGLLLTPLKRRADTMGLPLPYEIARTPASGRRMWRDGSGIARRMAQALRDEEDARSAGADDWAGGVDLSALAARLRGEPRSEVVLSLADLEGLIGDSLPEPMRRRRWWSNRPEALGHPQAASWMAAGWLAYPELRQGRVRFRRADAATRADASSAAGPGRAPG